MKLIIVLFLFLALSAKAQENGDWATPIEDQILLMDSVLFERGFNQCDLEFMRSLITEDFEFYHDKIGEQNQETFLQSMDENICPETGPKTIRKLVHSSMEVFPMFDNDELYGALQTGKHEFYLQEPGKEPYKVGNANFSQFWTLVDNQWKLSRVFSYNHQPAGD